MQMKILILNGSPRLNGNTMNLNQSKEKWDELYRFGKSL